ncbi:thermonuclease family protein [Methyloligella solikamskensis]|uniref:Thermonuclease family protein n=1 Tax=Methyloligella solikamskensis TaxID=1177756 RepID=A0ABW3J6X1_9HYPH
MVRVLLALALLLGTAAPAAAGTLLGFPDRIIDGDSFTLCEGRACKEIHLCGIKAPSEGEDGFQESSDALMTILGGNLIKCTQVGGGTPCDEKGKPTDGEAISAQCFVGTRDIAVDMVKHGFACDLVSMSGGRYSGEGEGKPCDTKQSALTPAE